MLKVRISVPDTAKKDSIIEVKTLVSHPMETGFRRDSQGQVIPRDIIKHFSCIYNNNTVFSADFFPSVSANPYLSFFLRASASGELVFVWEDQQGEVTRVTRQITVQD